MNEQGTSRALILPEPSPPALPVRPVPGLPLAVQVGRAGRLGDVGRPTGPRDQPPGPSSGRAST